MKKFLLFILSILGLLIISFGIFLLMIYWPVSTKGPKAYYRVDEGAVEVFGMKDGEVRSLLGYLRPGDTLMAPTASDASLDVPFWLSWMEPAIVDLVSSARYFMYKQGKKAKYDEFTVGYTNKTIRGGFVKELERTGLLQDIELDFLPGEFYFFVKVLGISITSRAVVSVPAGGDDRLLLHIRRLQIGPITVPNNAMKAIENLFANAYEQAVKYNIKLLRINFKEDSMVMTFRKKSGKDTGTFN